MEYFLVETSGLSLNCTNDYDKLMSCNIDDNNCTRLKLTVLNDGQTETCAFESCVRGCCCSTEMDLYYGDELLARVFKDGQIVHKQTFKVHETIKPKAPHIDTHSQSNGIYEIQWRTNMKTSIREQLRAIVTYWKKGDDNKISRHENITTYKEEDKYCSVIYGQDLEPSTTYVISVKTYTAFGLVSDNSNEMEFTTASSTNGGLIALILCLSVFAIVGSSVAFSSFFKLKGKLWDKAAKDEKPDILDFKPNKKAVLTPESLSVDSLSVEPLVSKNNLTLSKESLSDYSSRSGQTSGISTASSSLDYANTEPVDMEACVLEALKNAFPIFTPAEDICSLEGPKTFSPIVFDNIIYFSNEINSTEDVDLQTSRDRGAVMECTQPEEASSSSQNLLTVEYGYQEFEKLVEQSKNTSSVEKAGEYQSVMDQSHCVIIPHTSNDMIVDHGYHCV